VASLSQGRTAAAQCGLFTHKSVPVIFEPPCMCTHIHTRDNSAEICTPTIWNMIASSSMTTPSSVLWPSSIQTQS